MYFRLFAVLEKVTNAFGDSPGRGKGEGSRLLQTLAGVVPADQRKRFTKLFGNDCGRKLKVHVRLFGSEGCNYLGAAWKCCNYNANVLRAFIMRRSPDLHETRSLNGKVKLTETLTGSIYKYLFCLKDCIDLNVPRHYCETEIQEKGKLNDSFSCH